MVINTISLPLEGRANKDGLKYNRAYFKGTISRSEVPNSPFFGVKNRQQVTLTQK
jgi:hypothetical protein